MTKTLAIAFDAYGTLVDQTSVTSGLKSLDAKAKAEFLSMGVHGALSGFFPVIDGSFTSGRAMPVLLRRTTEPSKNMREGLVRAVQEASTGSVLVIHSESEDCNTRGGLTGWYAKTRGISGVVVDGAVRDPEEIREVGLQVYYRHHTPVSGFGRLFVASIGKPIRIDSLVIHEGDIVVADSDGVAVVPKANASEVIRRASEIEKTEKRTKITLQHTSCTQDKA